MLSSFYIFRKPVPSEKLSVQDCLKVEASSAVSLFVSYVYNQAKQKGIQIIPSNDRPNLILEQTSRSVLAAIIWHCGLGM